MNTRAGVLFHPGFITGIAQSLTANFR